MTPTRAAGLVIFRKCDAVTQYLLLQTSYGNHHWTPPKGRTRHVDHGETDWITALRETYEESGFSEKELMVYKNISKTLNYDVQGKQKEVVYWLAKLKDPGQNVTLSNEHQDFKWLPLEEAQTISGYDDMKQLLADFHEKAKTL